MKFRRIVGTAMFVVFVAAGCLSYAGCAPKEQQRPVDESKTQMYVANFEGANGSEWLDEAIADFEAANELTSFETGKTGIQIWPTNKKDELTGDILITNMPFENFDLYFLDHAIYEDIVGEGVAEEITDVVTQAAYGEDGELSENGTASIEDKMLPAFRDRYNRGTEEEPVYYAIPYFSGVGGIIYDWDLFNERKWFFDKNGEIGVSGTDPDIGPGPDGDYETTFDNGEPPTWNHFATLVETIRGSGLTPFTWSGTYNYPKNFALNTIWANYEGAANAQLMYTLSGTHSELGEITEATGYKLFESEGVKAAVKAAETIVSNEKNYSFDATLTATQTQTAAQEEFVYSITKTNRIAMLLESSYWENEARGVFNDMSDNPAYAYGKRNFAYMTPPRFIGTEGVEDQNNTRTTIWATAGQKMIVMNKVGPQKEAAKAFLLFIHQRSQLAKATLISNSPRPYDFVATEEELQAYGTPFMRDVIETITSDTVDLVYEIETASLIRNNTGYFAYTPLSGQFGGGTAYEPIEWLMKNRSKTWTDYLNGIADYGEMWPDRA